MTLQQQTRRTTQTHPKVDYHCHIDITEYTDPAHPTVIHVTPDEFRADLQEAGIDKAVILASHNTTPEQVATFTQKDPTRFIGFGMVNPLSPGAAEETRRQHTELGLHGLKLYPCTDGYPADHPDAFKVYEAAAEQGMPVMLHQAGMPTPKDLLKHTDPAQIDVVAGCFPDLKLVLAHLGYPRVDETLYVARKHRNVWLDLSWPYGDVNHPSFQYMLWRDLLAALNLGVIDRVVFGTDYPGVRQRPYLDMIMNINRYASHPDLRIPMDRLSAMLDVNVLPLLP